MSADGDTVRDDIVNAARTEIAKVDHGLASEPWAVRPLLQALDAALARLEAAAAGETTARYRKLDALLREAMEQKQRAERQRDELLHLLEGAGMHALVRKYRAALAEAGLE